jgi:hypothetical protein
VGYAQAVGRQLLGFLAPVGRFLVVDDVVCAELFQRLCFFGRRRRADYGCAGGFGEL